MPRRKHCRFIAGMPACRFFKPQGIPACDLEEIVLALDELEALRLADAEGLYQEQAAETMGVSRQTFGRIIETARKKVATALVKGQALRFDGGVVAVSDDPTAGRGRGRGQCRRGRGQCRRGGRCEATGSPHQANADNSGELLQ